jgi:dihydropteroate synthase
MLEEGADVIDVGGESTRPGATTVVPDEELARVLPVIEALRDLQATGDPRHSNGGGEDVAQRPFRISIDTRNAATAQAAVGAGADLINDVSAGLWQIAADLGVGWVAMHMAGQPQTMQEAPEYHDVVQEVVEYLGTAADRARAAGVEEVWVDPGIGFGKSIAHNLELLGSLRAVVGLGYPVVVGTSRKRTFGALAAWSDSIPPDGQPRPTGQFDDLGIWAENVGLHTPTGTDDRIEGSLVSAAWAYLQGATMFRVHDVASTRAALAAVSAASVAPKEN